MWLFYGSRGTTLASEVHLVLNTRHLLESLVFKTRHLPEMSVSLVTEDFVLRLDLGSLLVEAQVVGSELKFSFWILSAWATSWNRRW